MPFEWVMYNGVWVSIDLAPAEFWKVGEVTEPVEGGQELDSYLEEGF